MDPETLVSKSSWKGNKCRLLMFVVLFIFVSSLLPLGQEAVSQELEAKEKIIALLDRMNTDEIKLRTQVFEELKELCDRLDERMRIMKDLSSQAGQDRFAGGGAEALRKRMRELLSGSSDG